MLFEMYSDAERRLALFLNVLAATLAIIALLVLILPYLAIGNLLGDATPFFVTNTVGGLGLLAICARVAAGDVRRYRGLLWTLVVGFSVAIVCCLFVLATPRFGEFGGAVIVTLLASSLGAVGLWAFIIPAQSDETPWRPWVPTGPTTEWEQRGKRVFGVLALLSFVGAAASFFFGLNPSPALADVFGRPTFLIGSTVKVALLGVLMLMAWRDLRRGSHWVVLFVAGNIVSLASILSVILRGPFVFNAADVTLLGLSFSPMATMFAAVLLDVSVIGVTVYTLVQVRQSLLSDLKFFGAIEFRALEAIAETLIAGGDDEVLKPHEIAFNSDAKLSQFRASQLGLAKLAIFFVETLPMVSLLPPISYMHPAARRAFINRTFREMVQNPPWHHRLLNRLFNLVNGISLRLQRRSSDELNAALDFTGLLAGALRFNMQIAYLGYYGDERVWPSIGYRPFTQRLPDYDFEAKPKYPVLNGGNVPYELEVMTPDRLSAGTTTISDADVVIVGSGAAGGMLAHELAQISREDDKPLKIVVLEKGLHVKPSDFSEDEAEMVGKLYGSNALQISRSLRFTVLQGSCVGGTTVVNNAVCFDTPEEVLERWNTRGFKRPSEGDVLDSERYYASQAAVRDLMRIKPISAGTRQPLEGGVLNHGDAVLRKGVETFLNGDERYDFDVVEANIVDCLGCGYCNIGCAYGRKMSMLDWLLPKAQKAHGADKLQIYAEADVTNLVTSVDGSRVTQVEATLPDERKLVINNPKTVILSGGTIASSWLLMQSKIGADLPVGKGLSFNMGSPLHGYWKAGEDSEGPLNSFDGLQIAHYLRLDPEAGERLAFVYESWYNPPVAQAFAMPGWLDTHFQNMSRYAEINAAGVLVGTESNAHVERALLTGQPEVVYAPTEDDLETLVQALHTLGNIMFAGGAREVYASTGQYHAFTDEARGMGAWSAQAWQDGSAMDELRKLVRDDRDILLGTGHPQGGNAIGLRPDFGAEGSVVGPDFRVFGVDNLYVCDASVHPTSTTVNPQLTVMTLAHYAAPLIYQGHRER